MCFRRTKFKEGFVQGADMVVRSACTYLLVLSRECGNTVYRDFIPLFPTKNQSV